MAYSKYLHSSKQPSPIAVQNNAPFCVTLFFVCIRMCIIDFGKMKLSGTWPGLLKLWRRTRRVASESGKLFNRGQTHLNNWGNIWRMADAACPNCPPVILVFTKWSGYYLEADRSAKLRHDRRPAPQPVRNFNDQTPSEKYRFISWQTAPVSVRSWGTATARIRELFVPADRLFAGCCSPFWRLTLINVA